MSNARVRFFVTEDLEVEWNQNWHLITTSMGDPVSFCGGQVFGHGQGAIEEEGVHYETGEGRITCEHCRERIKEIKAVDLR